MFSAGVQDELFVAEFLKVLFHFFERVSAGRTSGVENPRALRAPPATKTWLVDPYQLARHGSIIRFLFATRLFPDG